MNRRQLRYILHRIKSFETDNSRNHNADEIKEFYESQPGFTSWRNFSIKWDVGKNGNHDEIKEITNGD